MDLPTCPSCGQSVLDDEAVDCPFCGVSMSARPGAKPARPAAPAAKDEKPAPVKKAAEKKPAGKPDAADEDPFGVAAPVGRKAVQLLAKPVSGKLHRIICPMCETAGFSSKQAAGKEVRCANPQCLVPVFTAPALESSKPTEAAPVETAPKKLGVGAYAGIGVGAAVLLAAGTWFFTAGPSKRGGENEFDPSKFQAAGEGTVVIQNGSTPAVTPDETQKKVETPTGPKTLTADDYRREAMALMAKYSLDSDRNNRKPFCRQVSAEAAIRIGDLARAEQELKQLDLVRAGRLAYYRILPLVELGWHHLKAGDAASAGKRATEALETPDFPTSGMTGIDNATELATLLVALDRAPEARTLLKERFDAGDTGALMESYHRAQNLKISFAEAADLRPAAGWSNPQAAAVAIGLVARGYDDKGLAWAQQTPGDGKIAALSAWAEGLLSVAKPGAIERIRSELSKETAALQARILARCALIVLQQGGKDAASALIDEARKTLGTAAPEPLAFPNLKKDAVLNLPDAEALRRSALAAADCGRVLQALGRADEATAMLHLALAYTRAMTPSTSLAQRAFDETTRSAAAVTAEIKELRGLQTDDDARNAFVQYRQRCTQLLDATKARQDFQQQLLTTACDWGLVDVVWNEVRSRATATDPALKEPWFETTLPARLLAYLEAAGRSDEAAALKAAAGEERLKKNDDPRARAWLSAVQSAKGSDYQQIAAMLQAFISRRDLGSNLQWHQDVLLRLASQMIRDKRYAEALQLTAAIQDAPTRELVYERVAAELTAAGQPALIMEAARNVKLIPPDRIALLRGLIERLPANLAAPSAG